MKSKNEIFLSVIPKLLSLVVLLSYLRRILNLAPQIVILLHG